MPDPSATDRDAPACPASLPRTPPTITRPVQTSFMEGMDRPTGPILPSVFSGTNSDLMAAVAPLYLTGSVLDVTYGNGDTAGGWWKRAKPAPFAFHDLALDGVDFRSLPEPEDSFDTVCFDPPYIPAGGKATARDAGGFRERFGLATGITYKDMILMMEDGLAECSRVASRYVLAKCSDFVTSGKFTLAHKAMLDEGERLGLTVHDLIVHHTGSGPGGQNIYEVKRARRAHSYLLVFAVNGAERSDAGAQRSTRDEPGNPEARRALEEGQH